MILQYEMESIMKKTVFIIVFLLLTSNGLFAQDYQSLKKECQTLWIERDKADSLNKAIENYSKFLTLTKDKEEKKFILCRLSHAYYILGDSMSESEKRKKAFLKGTQKANNALQMVENDPNANFFYVANHLCYLNETSFFRANLFLSEVYHRLDVIMKKDKYFLYGGPQRIKSRIIHFAPFYLRNRFTVGTLYSAEKMLKEAIQSEPDFALNRLFLADIYLDMNQKKLAKKELINVLRSPVNNDLEYAAENRIYKQRGKILLKKHFPDYAKTIQKESLF